jgi:hypothetical protein
MGAQVSDTDIFISYSREDRARAHDFARALTDRGLNVWWDAALHSGENFDEVIEAQLKAAKAVLVLWSPRSVKSRWVRAEATLADRRNKLIPVIIEPCDRPIIFELAHTIDLAHWHGDSDDPAWQTFLSDLMRLARPEAIAPAPHPSSQSTSIKVEERRGVGLPDHAQVDDDEDEYQPTQFINWRSTTAQSHWLLQPSADVPEMQYVIGPKGLKIGRGHSADVVLRDSQISRTHCMVMLKEDELHVVDLNSTNGTFVDEERIGGEAVLPVGSTLRVGSISLVHQLRESDSI